ncbi:dockerin type I domain-containing protein [Blastopirellula retiformator]|nr:dockerin type I domain-containing protein [Blastopirellula retiformator]
MLASDLNAWHNPTLAHDVNGDNLVDHNDLEIVVSQLRLGSRSLSSSSQSAGGLEGEQVVYLDINNDGLFTPMDLNSLLGELLEAEDAGKEYSAAFTFEIIQEDDMSNPVVIGTAVTDFDPNSQDPIIFPEDIEVEQKPFTLNIYIRNTSAITGVTFGMDESPDIAAAFLNINFDSSIVTPTDAGSFAAPFDNDGGIVPAIDGNSIVNAGGGTTFSDSQVTGGWESNQLLYTVEFNPTQSGAFMLQGEMANLEDENDPDQNAAAVVFTDARIEQNGMVTQLDIVNLAFPKFNVTVLQRPGANNDSVDVSADLVNEIEAGDTRIVEIDGVNYLAIDVKANDLNFNGDPLTDGSEVDLALGNSIAIDELPDDQALQQRVMIYTQTDYAIAGFSDEYLVYLLPSDQSGVESFEYMITDPNAVEDPTTATVTVNIAQVLVAVDDGDATTPFAEVEPNQTVTLLVLEEVNAPDFTGENPDFIAGDGMEDSLGNIVITDVAGQAFDDGRLVIAADGKSLAYTGAALPGLETFTYTITYVDDLGDPILDDLNQPITDMATVTVRIPINSRIGGGLYFDVNNNGAWDGNGSTSATPEQFIGGIRVELYDGGTLVAETFSSEADGTFEFLRIEEGTYSIKINQPKFVYKFGTGLSGALPANWSVQSDGSVVISNMTISATGVLEFNGLNLGYLGRTGAYRGLADQLSDVGDESITFAVSKQADGSGVLEWYSVDEGWSELVKIDGFLFNSTTKTGQAVLLIDQDGDSATPDVVAPITFSPNHPNFVLIADTDDAVIFMLNGDIETIVDHLSTVDVAFSDF